MHSSLRRPATSHQRSATLQQYFSEDEVRTTHQSFRPSVPLNELREDQHVDDDGLPSNWQPFFKPHVTKLVKDGSSRRRSAAGSISRVESLKTIVPNINELPTLVSAASITSRSSDDAIDSGATRRPATTVDYSSKRFSNSFPLSYGDVRTEIYADHEPPPRRSFTLSGIFPSSSPSRWKIPRSSSQTKTHDLQASRNTRRAVSAPHATRPIQNLSNVQGSSRSRILTRPQQREQVRPSSSGFSIEPQDPGRTVPSSSLPPLNRLSAFEIDLPGVAPSYPASPQLDQSSTSPVISSTPPPTASSPLGPLAFNTLRNKSHRPSGAPSDHASTLLGSDNSRFLSSDEDDIDGRSETIYDSTRTGATGSSHSGVRRPPIDTVFDGLPPPEISKDKLLALQDMLDQDSISGNPTSRADIVEEEEEDSTPIHTSAPCKEEDHPTSAQKPNNSLSPPNLSPSSPKQPSNMASADMDKASSPASPDDEAWFISETNDADEATSQGREVVTREMSSGNPPVSSSPCLPTMPHSLSTVGADRTSRSHLFDWSEQPSERDSHPGSSPRPKTVHGKNSKEMRGSRLNGRRGPNALHLRSQSVPVPSDGGSHRNSSNTSKLESWVLGNKGVSEDWDGDFDFEDPSPRPTRQATMSHEYTKASSSTGMLVPRSIMERQASVHGQFGQVKELTLLVEELKRLQQQARAQGIMQGQSAELWKEADGIINLATVDDEEQDLLPPRSPRSPSFDFDEFDDDSPAGRSRRRKSAISSTKEDRLSGVDAGSRSDTPLQTPSRSSPDKPNTESPLPISRPRKESEAKAKFVLENIHHQRTHYDLNMLEQSSQKKLPFDTTSLRDLVTRAGVVTRALKEIVRQAGSRPHTPEARPSTPPDPIFSQIFHKSHATPTPSRSPRATQSPKSGSFIGGTMAGNDNDINGHMKIMTVV